MIRCLFYGSLRKGEYNYDRFLGYFGKESMKYIQTVRVPNFKMYDLGAYPCVVRGDIEDFIVVDIVDVSPDCYRSIYNMELGAGYSETSVNVEEHESSIFTYDNMGSRGTQVKNGDWVTYNYQKKKEKV